MQTDNGISSNEAKEEAKSCCEVKWSCLFSSLFLLLKLRYLNPTNPEAEAASKIFSRQKIITEQREDLYISSFSYHVRIP